MKPIILFLIIVINIQAQCIKTNSSGDLHTVFIKTDSTMWGTGKNTYGQLGTGVSLLTQINVPSQIGGLGWKAVASGWYHNIALKSDGTIWAWGRNNYGQLGINATGDRSIPTKIGIDNDWKYIAADYTNSYGIKTNGTLWAWGNNTNGALGDGTNVSKNIPTQVGTDNNWLMVEGGWDNTFAIKTDGTLWSWGLNSVGQLGNGNTIDTNTPAQIGTLNNWKYISAGYTQFFAIKTDGSLWAWGLNNNGQLGDGTTLNKNTPIQIGTDINWQSVSTYAHTLGLKTDGTLWSWGKGAKGQLGHGNTFDLSIPTKIGTANNWEYINVGNSDITTTNPGYNSFASKSDNSFWDWGANFMGQLGLGDNAGRLTPILFNCNAIGIDELLIINSPFTIYPNPTTNILNIQNSQSKKIDEITIKNMLGEIIFNYKGSVESIDILDLKDGIYFIELISENFKYQTKIIKS